MIDYKNLESSMDAKVSQAEAKSLDTGYLNHKTAKRPSLVFAGENFAAISEMFTEVEREIAKLAAKGLDAEEIARRLEILPEDVLTAEKLMLHSYSVHYGTAELQSNFRTIGSRNGK